MAICAFSVVVVVFRQNVGGLSGRAAAMAASSSFILAALLSGALWTTYGRYVLAGLSFCWLGDLFGPMDFRLGVACFLIGHFGFIAAFAMEGLKPLRTIVAGTIAAAAGAALFLLFKPHLPDGHLGLVAAYIIVISVMATTAIGTHASRRAWIIPVAAALFYVSDVFVARWAYLAPNPLNVWLTYPLYYASCMAFALSISRVGGDARNAQKAPGVE
ncbi:MAG: lysoplasmalogenase [bacterium]|nr:lysoplasmalogenase [bacterium]